MIPVDDRGGAREIALGLTGALGPALAETATPEAVKAAREAAQVLGLDGLDLLLNAIAPHAGHAWPAELAPALERLRRLVARATESGALDPFREVDRDLAGLAGEVSALQWSPAPGAEPRAAQEVATLGLADTLDDMPLADDASRELAGRARLLPPVAAALRAALDWLAGDSGRPLTLRAEDAVLEVTCERVSPEGLDPATEVLAAVQANVGPAPAGPQGAWVVRVPLHAGHGLYLMLVQGGVPMAVPWHAVLRLRMADAADLRERHGLGEWPLVEGPVPGAAPAASGEVPLALVAHGRKRGWLFADRLVWRLHAELVVPEGAATTAPAPAPGLSAIVETEEGDFYWLAEPAFLLRALEAPPLEHIRAKLAADAGPPTEAKPAAEAEAPAPVPVPAPEPVPPPVAVAPPPAPAAVEPAVPPPPVAVAPPPAPVAVEPTTPRPPEAAESLSPAAVEPAVRPEPVPAPVAVPPPARRAPQLRLLTSEDVEPLEEPAAPAPAPRPAPRAPVRPPDSVHGVPRREAPAPPSAIPAAPGPRPRRSVLVAEDSITARIFLTRLLERAGLEVRAVETASALRAELERGGWSLVCVDAELPDAAGHAFLAALVSRHGADAPFVALVRDADDRVAARRAGIERTLRKPFDEGELEQVLGRLGLIARKA